MTAVTEIRLPQFGMGMQEGTIIAWHKREGDRVATGEVVAEIEAEKVTEELFATGDGVLQRILVPEGDTAAVNELLAVIVPAGAIGADVGAGERDTGEEERTAIAAAEPATRSHSASAPTREEERTAIAAAEPLPDHPTATPATAGPHRQVTPRARRLAGDLGIDLDSVVGTGPGGRVTEDDITAAATGSS